MHQLRNSFAAFGLAAVLVTPAENGESGVLDLTQEGGHRARRVVHAGDITGREIQRVLSEAVRNHPNIRMLDWHMGVDLITLSKFGGPDYCVGAYVLDERAGAIETVLSRTTVLALGDPPARGDARKIEDDGNAAQAIVDYLAEKRLV